MKKRSKIGLAVLIPLLMVAAFLAFGFLIQFLWNFTISDIFAVKEITFWQALGLFVLGKLITGSQIQWSNSKKKEGCKKDKSGWCKDGDEYKYSGSGLDFLKNYKKNMPEKVKVMNDIRNENSINSQKQVKKVEKDGWNFSWWGISYKKGDI